MALIVTPDMNDISLCESAAGWSTGVTNDAFKLEGNYCLGLKVSEAESALIAYTFGTAVDMSNGEHVYFPVQVQGLPDTKANGGIRVYAEDSSGNYGYFNIAGSENYPGGWVIYCYAPGATYTTGSGTVNTASIKKVGVRFKTLSKALGNSPNCFWDAVRYGKGLKCTSGLSDGISLQDIVDAEENDKYWGVIRKIGGVFFVKGKLYFGDTSSGDIDFKETGQVVIFEDLEFGEAGFHEIVVQGNASGVTNFQFGETVGGRGISGCFLKSAGTLVYKFTATDNNIDKLLLYGTTFYNAGTIALPVSAAHRESISCNFEACAEILPDTCKLEYFNIVNADDRGVRIANASHNIKNGNFINCPHCTHVNFSAPVDFDGLIFSGSEGSTKYDIEHSVSGALTVNAKNGANPVYVEETGGGSTAINNPVTHSLTGLMNGSEVTYVKVSDQSVVFHVESVTGNQTDYPYNYGGDVEVDILIMHLNYKPIAIEGVILKNADADIPIVQMEDPDYLNP